VRVEIGDDGLQLLDQGLPRGKHERLGVSLRRRIYDEPIGGPARDGVADELDHEPDRVLHGCHPTAIVPVVPRAECDLNHTSW
jgi:hypothetical protein